MKCGKDWVFGGEKGKDRPVPLIETNLLVNFEWNLHSADQEIYLNII